MRLAEPAEVPAGARRIAAIAEAAGWTVVATYARGTWPSKTPRVVDSLALRMRHPAGRRSWALWHDGKFHAACSWAADRPIRMHNATALKAVLSSW
jgi:hypothetical protein